METRKKEAIEAFLFVSLLVFLAIALFYGYRVEVKYNELVVEHNDYKENCIYIEPTEEQFNYEVEINGIKSILEKD